MHERSAMAHRRSGGGDVRPYVRSSKPRFNWTADLKLLFEEAMILLGGARKATPKQVREIMKCPDIQLSHIKSRLQMCRIRMEEKERRSGISDSPNEFFRGLSDTLLRFDSSEKSEGSKRRETVVDNIEVNGDERSVVVDENEPNDCAHLNLSKPCSSLEYQSQLHSIQPSSQSPQRSFKRLRDSSFQSNQYHLDYYLPPRQECSAAVPQFSAASFIFREDHLNAPKRNKREGWEEEEKEELQLSLSLSNTARVNKINLDLSLSFSES